VRVTRRNSSMRVEQVSVASSRGLVINGQYEIRERFSLPSTLFLIKLDGDNVIFMGNGHGHGVGMCQSGAIARANSGYTFEEILMFYYVGTEIGIMNSEFGIRK